MTFVLLVNSSQIKLTFEKGSNTHINVEECIKKSNNKLFNFGG